MTREETPPFSLLLYRIWGACLVPRAVSVCRFVWSGVGGDCTESLNQYVYSQYTRSATRRRERSASALKNMVSSNADASLLGSSSTTPGIIQRLAIASVFFAAFSLRMFVPSLWALDVYIPVLSPIYRQQEHWRCSSERILAVVAHVACGIVMLCIAVLQLDAPSRHASSTRHRWLGRLYVASGLGAVLALRWLRSTSGGGSARRGDPLMRGFIDCASMAWLLATARGVVAMAVQRDARAHSRWMALSMGFAMVPILQRVLNFFLVPVALALRAAICLVQAGLPPWCARFGPPGSMLSVLSGPCGTCSAAADPRACPAILSADGYGEAEQAVFAVSAWSSLLGVLAYGAALCLSPTFAELQLGVDDTRLRDVSTLEACRSVFVPLVESLVDATRSGLRKGLTRCRGSQPSDAVVQVMTVLLLPLVALATNLCGVLLPLLAVSALLTAALTLALGAAAAPLWWASA